jgi:hypothetical protein
MAIFPGRTGRRRRVLNEEVLSASSSHVALRAAGTPRFAEEQPPRYSEAASVENHPQITDFIPRRFGTFAMMAVVALLSTVALEAMHLYAGRVAAVLGTWATAPIDLTAPGNLGSWLSAVLLLLGGLTCLLVYSIRRHKIADDRGRYRIWLAASAMCLLLSVSSVAPWHRLLAAAAAHYTPWAVLRESAFAWVLLAGLPLGWIAVRVLVDMWESKLATSAFVATLLCYLTAVAGRLGWLPAVGPVTVPMAVAGATLIGHWMLLLAAVGYARFVVLDAQGLIATRTTRPRDHQDARTKDRQATRSRTVQETREMSQKALRAGRGAGASDVDEDQDSYGGSIKAFRRQQKMASRSGGAAAETEWVDGTQPDPADYDDGPDGRQRKLSKSERKQLRKLKARDRAA